MPAGTPNFGEGTTLEVNDGASSAYVAIVGATNIDPPDASAIEVDRNRLSVTTMKERAFSTRLDPGDMSFTYETTDVEAVRVEALKNVSKGWRVSLPDGLRLAFTGVLKTNKIQGVQGDALTMSQCTVRAMSLITISDI